MAGTRKLGRPTAAKVAMIRGMVTFLLEKGKGQWGKHAVSPLASVRFL